jgi:peptide methionine sulfoxide reductase MsrA
MDIDTKEFWQSEPLHQLYLKKRTKLAKKNYFCRLLISKLKGHEN